MHSDQGLSWWCKATVQTLRTRLLQPDGCARQSISPQDTSSPHLLRLFCGVIKHAAHAEGVLVHTLSGRAVRLDLPAEEQQQRLPRDAQGAAIMREKGAGAGPHGPRDRASRHELMQIMEGPSAAFPPRFLTSLYSL